MTKATAHPDHRLISSEDVQGTDVYGMGDEVIGQIDHLLIEKVSGLVAYAVMSFGGFLGLAHSHYPIPWSALKYDTGVGGYRTGITEQQLKDAPAFSASLRMQVFDEQVQPVPLMETKVSPAGTVSVTVATPLVGLVPELLTVMV